MIQKFIENGYKIVENHEKADIYIINTCTVTNMSDRKSRQMLRRVKELNSKSIVVACGCYAQVAKKELEKIKEIDLILGNNEKGEIVEHVEDYIKNQEKINIEDVMQQREFVDFGNVTYTEKTRAVIKVQDGCDRFCSYCIIPYARGRVRSRKPENVLAEIRKVAEEGIKEVVITGIHVASYGKDFKTEYKEAQDALKHDTLYKANILEANTHLSNAIESLTKPEYKEVVKAATLEKDGSIDDTCVNCGDVRKSTPIAKIASIDLDKTSFTENGQAQKPSVTVKDSTGAVISADNYTVSYSDANSTKAGTYKVTVKFNGKKYAGTKELSYTISAKPAATTTVTNAATVKAPAKTTVKLSKAKKTSIKVSWKKISGVAAYQIQYSTSKNFKKAKTVKVSAKSASKVLKKLKKNKKYYVRVRSYKVTKVNNKSKNVYSAWSAKKALKTKKK